MSSFERGFVVAAVRALGAKAPVWLDRRYQTMGQAALRLIEDRALLDEEQRRIGAWPSEGLDRAHPSWWPRLPSSSRLAARLFLERCLAARLVPLPPPAPWHRSRALLSLDALASERLAELIVALGRRRIAVAFSEASPQALEELCRRLGEPAAAQLVVEVRRLRPLREEVMAAQHALFKFAVEARHGHSFFRLAGCRWLAPALASQGGDLLRRVAQRLPLSLGQMLLGESGAAASPVDLRFCTEAVADLAPLV